VPYVEMSDKGLDYSEETMATEIRLGKNGFYGTGDCLDVRDLEKMMLKFGLCVPERGVCPSSLRKRDIWNFEF
jgi:hypothetical protein